MTVCHDSAMADVLSWHGLQTAWVLSSSSPPPRIKTQLWITQSRHIKMMLLFVSSGFEPVSVGICEGVVAL
jgi:hypothetical protein